MRKITKGEIEQIFNTLPVSYYLGRKINVELNDGNTSFFDSVKDHICIGANTIIQACSSLSDDILKSIDLEEVVRGLLYHEISHVILSPNNLYSINSIYKDVINIFEDERIECILKDFYMNVNFKRNVFLLNNYNPAKNPKNALEKFYYIVRFRQGEKEYIDRVNKIIIKYSNINSTYSTHYYNSKYTAVSNYVNDIIELYEDIKKNFEENLNNNQTNNQDSNQDSNQNQTKSSNKQDSNQNQTKSSNDSNTENSMNSSSMDNSSDINNMDVNEEFNIDKINDLADIVNDNIVEVSSKTIINEAINKTVNFYYDGALINKLNLLIDRKVKQRHKNGSAINSYCGKFVVKNVAIRDDYMWWSQQNREGHIRRFSKVHFNLYIDNSGSFCRNDAKMNTFIRALSKINNSDFSFDVITINTKIVEWTSYDKLFESYGGNKVPKELEQVVRRHNKRNAFVYNIVLFDGDAHSDDCSTPRGTNDNLRFFDSNNTIIISDNDNKKYFDKCITKAKIVYTLDYCDTFINHIIKLLDRVM